MATTCLRSPKPSKSFNPKSPAPYRRIIKAGGRRWSPWGSHRTHDWLPNLDFVKASMSHRRSWRAPHEAAKKLPRGTNRNQEDPRGSQEPQKRAQHEPNINTRIHGFHHVGPGGIKRLPRAPKSVPRATAKGRQLLEKTCTFERLHPCTRIPNSRNSGLGADPLRRNLFSYGNSVKNHVQDSFVKNPMQRILARTFWSGSACEGFFDGFLGQGSYVKDSWHVRSHMLNTSGLSIFSLKHITQQMGLKHVRSNM